MSSCATSGSQWPLHDASIRSQQSHLQDWRVAGSVRRRTRRLGKEAFFSCKIFVLDLDLDKWLHEQKLSRLSTDDQHLACRYIKSIILTGINLRSPSPFISLPRCIAGFPRLERFDFYFGGQPMDPSAWIIRAVKDRMQLPSTLNDALVRMGIPTEKLAMGILISPDTKWSFHEGLLETNVYPMLRIWVGMKSRKEAKKVDG